MAAYEEHRTIEEVAAERKINQTNRPAIRNRIDSGYLPAIRIGLRIRGL